ncbi:MAG: phosphoribosyltransferase family protein [Nocardioidaceae bacterium]
MPGLVDAALDLFTGSACAGCAIPGRALCATCRAGLPHGARLSMPTPSPEGLLPVYAAGEYDGVVRSLVLAHKERNRLALAGPLGLVLASVVADLPLDPVPVRLVPVPSARSVTRARGHDPLLRVTRSAASVLRAAGVDARATRLLSVRRRPEDQAGLGSEARQANLAGAFAVPAGRARAVPASQDSTWVLVDDVVTTGATLRAAQSALESAGVPVAVAACIAATQRRAKSPRSPD